MSKEEAQQLAKEYKESGIPCRIFQTCEGWVVYSLRSGRELFE